MFTFNVDDLLTANLCVVTLLNSKQCSQFERFRVQHGKMVNKTSSFNIKLTVMLRRAELTAKHFDVSLSHVVGSRILITNYCSANYGQKNWIF